MQQPNCFERSTGANMPDHSAAALPDSPENSQKLVCYLICCISWQQRRLLEFLQFSMRWKKCLCVCVCVVLYSFGRTLSEFVPVSMSRRLRCTSMSTRNFSLRFGSSSLCKTWVCVCVRVYVCVSVSRETMCFLKWKVFSRRMKQHTRIQQAYTHAHTCKLSCIFFFVITTIWVEDHTKANMHTCTQTILQLISTMWVEAWTCTHLTKNKHTHTHTCKSFSRPRTRTCK